MSELPARAFFSYAVPAARRPERRRTDGSISEWGDDTLLPDLGQMDGQPGFAEVRLAWDEAGLYVGLEVKGKTNVVSHRQNPHSADALFLWVDTRDVRDAHRASRFCHHFIALPRGGGSQRRGATAWQAPIRRAREQPPLCEPAQLKVASRARKDGYGLELALTGGVLTGFDPGECSRLGFTFLVTDHELGWQTWSVPGRLPYQVDPSTWGTILLGD